MKALITLKTPDVLDCQPEEIKELAKKWFNYGEYLTVEIDTDAKTCTVKEVK